MSGRDSKSAKYGTLDVWQRNGYFPVETPWSHKGPETMLASERRKAEATYWSRVWGKFVAAMTMTPSVTDMLNYGVSV